MRADEVREYLEAGFDRLERDPAVALEEFARRRSMPGSTPPTSQLDWLSSTTTMSVLL